MFHWFLTRKTIRRRLLRYARLFNKENCMYNYNEQIACNDLLYKISPVDPVLETFNTKNPDHGEKIKK